MKNRIIRSIFILCILAMASFSLWFLLIEEPIGDDVFGHYTMGISYYLDEIDDTLGEEITSFGQAFETVKLIYHTWSGRVLGYVFLELNGVLPNIVKALIGTGTFLANVLLIMVIGFGSFKEASLHPFVFSVIYLVMYRYRVNCFFEYMWTMISVYEITLMVCLTFCLIMIRSRHQGKRELIIATIVGFLAGASNEICAVMTISILGLMWLKKIITKEYQFRSIIYYIGLFVGTAVCVLAPGNFNRSKQSHDATLRTLTIFERMKNSLSSHKDILIPVDDVVRTALALLIMFAVIAAFRYITKNKVKGIKTLWDNTFPFAITAIISIIVWGFMPGTPLYGLSFSLAIAFMLILRAMNTSMDDYVGKWANTFGTMGAFVVVTWFTVKNVPWLMEYQAIREQRIVLIDAAVERGIDEVIVPKYPDSLNNNLIVIDYLNGRSIFETDAYLEYWGTRVVIE